MAERKLPAGMENPPDAQSSFTEKMIVETRKYKLITPLFGGGVEPNTPDPVTTIRATEIRGHLRFWWRATRGGQFKTIEELKAKEDEIWGTAAKFDKDGKVISGPSKINIEVFDATFEQEQKAYKVIITGIDQEGQKTYKTVYQLKKIAPEYFIFPLKPEQKDIKEFGTSTPIKSIYVGVSFNVKLIYPDIISKDIEASLWAWENFGGIGARTRRGFGAIKYLYNNNELPPSSALEFSDWISQKCNTHIIDKHNIDNLPTLSNNLDFSIISPKDTSLQVWNILSDILKNFRSKIDDTPFRKKDVDAIRNLFRNKNYKTNVHHFQRSYLGLPIAYQNLKGIYRSGKKIEKASLHGKQQQRLASPVILRPIACRDGKFIGIALKLKGTNLPEELTIDDYDFSISTENGPDVISAFMNFVRSNNND